MGFEVHVVVALPTRVSEAVMTGLDHQFEEVAHDRGSRTVTITEHVSMSSETDAVDFVRALVLGAVPEGSKISTISAESD